MENSGKAIHAKTNAPRRRRDGPATLKLPGRRHAPIWGQPLDASLGATLSEVDERTTTAHDNWPSAQGGNTDPNANVRGGALLGPRDRRVPLIWYVKHRLRDKSVETFRCNTEAKAHGICRDLKEAGEVAWVEDEQGRVVQDLGPNR